MTGPARYLRLALALARFSLARQLAFRGNVLLGAAVMGFALHEVNWTFDAVQIASFAVLFGCGVLIAYSFLVLLTATSVWLVRNQSLYEMWWLVTSLMRYPREIFNGGWAM